MIPLSLAGLVAAYACGLAAVLLLAWIVGNILRTLAARKRRRHCIQCMFCGALYEGNSAEPLPACPQCGRPNERTPPASV